MTEFWRIVECDGNEWILPSPVVQGGSAIPVCDAAILMDMDDQRFGIPFLLTDADIPVSLCEIDAGLGVAPSKIGRKDRFLPHGNRGHILVGYPYVPTPQDGVPITQGDYCISLADAGNLTGRFIDRAVFRNMETDIRDTTGFDDFQLGRGKEGMGFIPNILPNDGRIDILDRQPQVLQDIGAGDSLLVVTLECVVEVHMAMRVFGIG